MANSALDKFVRRANVLKKKALEIDVKEYVWCQRGCSGERIELVCALPTKDNRALLAFKTQDGETMGWFTAMMHLTRKSAEAANLTGSMNHEIYLGKGKHLYAVVAEWGSVSFGELAARLVAKGLPNTIMPKLGLVETSAT